MIRCDFSRSTVDADCRPDSGPYSRPVTRAEPGKSRAFIAKRRIDLGSKLLSYPSRISSVLTRGILVLLLGASSMGCGARSQSVVSIEDTAAILGSRYQEIEERLHVLADAKGVSVRVRSLSPHVELWKIAPTIDRLFKKDPWKGAPDKDRLITIFLLKDPTFLAVRYGSAAKVRALARQLYVDPSLIAQQGLAQDGDLPTALVGTVNALIERFPGPNDLNWFERLSVNEYAQEIADAIDAVTYSGWIWYVDYILKAILKILVMLGNWLGSPLLGATVTVLLLAIPLSLGLRRRPLIRILSQLVVAIPLVGSVLLLAHGRLEEQMFVSHLIGSSGSVRNLPPWLSGNLGIWVGLGFAVISAGKVAIECAWQFPAADLPSEKQWEILQEGQLGQGSGLSGKAKKIAFDALNTLKMVSDISSFSPPNFDAKKPYEAIAEASAQRVLQVFVRSTVVFAILPASLSVLLVTKDLLGVVAEASHSVAKYRRFNTLARMPAATQ